MLFASSKKEALKIHERTVLKYNGVYADTQYACEQLYLLRKLSVTKIEEIEALINSIASTPKEYEKQLSDIRAARIKFRQTEEYAAEAYGTEIKSGVSIAAGVAGGAAFAGIAPTAAMWVATTFGTASTGTAISSLTGAAASKAALAWLGGGALSAGGAGVAGGQALLALAGPIGWGITGVTTVASVAAAGHKNKKISEEAIAAAKEITVAGAQLHETEAIVSQMREETDLLLGNIKTQLSRLSNLRNADYTALDNDTQLSLGTLVNNTLSLAEMLNKTVG